MAEARAAGIDIVSFNSGAGAASGLGSALHIAVDEPAIGRKAGEAFTASGVEGDILCVIHEPNNIALSERCQGLDAAYDGGEVEQLPIYAAAVDDTRGRAGIVAGRLAQGGVGAVLTLGADAALPTLLAIQGTQANVRFGAVGFNGVTYEFSARGVIDFIIWDQPMVQGYLSAMALILSEHLRIDAAGWFAGARLTIDPPALRPRRPPADLRRAAQVAAPSSPSAPAGGGGRRPAPASPRRPHPHTLYSVIPALAAGIST